MSILDFFIAFTLGLIAGSFVTVFVLALCAAASRRDDWRDDDVSER